MSTFLVMHKYYFYIIYSSNQDTYYIGHTNDVKGRIQKHNTNHKGYTGRTNDWELKYCEVYNSKEEAYHREMKVKHWKNRKRLRRLIERGSEHPD